MQLPVEFRNVKFVGGKPIDSGQPVYRGQDGKLYMAVGGRDRDGNPVTVQRPA